RCQRCSRPICTSCMSAAPVGFQCRECVATGAKRVRGIRLGGVGTPYLTYALVLVNCVLAAACLLTDPDWPSGHIGSISRHLGTIGGGFTIENGRPQLIGVDQGEWYRIVTGAFIHAGPVHLAFNMLALWQIGMLLEPALGRLRFALVYFVALLG